MLNIYRIIDHKKIKTILFLSSLLLISSLFLSNVKCQIQSENLVTNKDSISVEMLSELNKDFTLWYPLSIDTVYGGFFSDIDYKWELDGTQNKMIVSQARHVWATSNASIFYSNDQWLLKIAEHGFQFLKNIMWDKKYGGFFELVDRQGKPIEENGRLVKTAYGNSFAIYGLAAYYEASGDTTALSLAKETFYWLEKHSYDKEYGGYFQYISRGGEPFKEGYNNTPPKDQNSSIHLLECLTGLYKVWKDKLVKERLSSLLILIRDKITTERGYLNLFFTQDWQPVSYRDSSEESRKKNYYFDHVSFGHDIETAYLMLEASDILGIEHDTITLMKAKKIVDHTAKNGWDKEHGGIYDGGYYFDDEEQITIVKSTKEWWAQVEAMNSFLLMSKLFPGDALNYYEKFCLQWAYIKKYLIDNVNGGWFWGGMDEVPKIIYSPKGRIWKVNYLTTRALINCLRKLSK